MPTLVIRCAHYNLARQLKPSLNTSAAVACVLVSEVQLLRVQALDAGSAAALPDGLRAELEQLEDHGGVRHLHDLCTQIKVNKSSFVMCSACAHDNRRVPVV